jgi:hypothetical protein
MIKYKETLIKVPYTRAKFFFLKKNLKHQWEVFLCTYECNKKKRPFDFYYLPFVSSRDHNAAKNIASSRIHRTIISPTTLAELKVCKKKLQKDHTKFFFFQEDKFSPFNFLIFSKLLDFLGNTPCIKTWIQTLLKLYNQYFELERFFPNGPYLPHRGPVERQSKSMNNTVPLLWIASLLIEQIYQFLTRTRPFFNFLNISIPAWKRTAKKNLKIKWSWLFFKCSDLLLSKWYQNKIHEWASRVLAKNKKIQFCATSCTNTLAEKKKHSNIFNKMK